MEKKIKIAFDLDGVIIDKPPLIPKKWLEWLFRGGKRDGLHYRFPKSKLEQRIRKLSHFYLFRPPIKKNIEFIKELAKNPKYGLYIISGRYSFLEEETKDWLSKRNIGGVFKEIFINFNDKQPHLFKEEVLKRIKPNIFVDDDYLSVEFLRQKLKNTSIFCFSKNRNVSIKGVLPNLSQILIK